MKSKGLIKSVIRIFVTTVLLIWAFSRIDLQQFWQTIKTARWEYLIVVWGITIIIFWVNSIKLQLILKKQGCNVRTSTLFGATAISLLYSMVMPGMLSTAVKWYILKKDTGKGSNILSSMLYNQFSVVIIMAVFGLAALVIANPTSLLIHSTKNQWLLPVICGALLVVTILISLLLLNREAGPKIITSLGFLLRPLPTKISQKGKEIFEQIAIFQTIGWRFHLTIAFITIIASFVGTFFTYILSAKAANISVPVHVFIWLCAFIYLLGRLPISVANLGVREVTLVGVLGLYKVDASAALLMSMILFSIIALMAIIGAVFQLCWMVPRPEKNKQS